MIIVISRLKQIVIANKMSDSMIKWSLSNSATLWEGMNVPPEGTKINYLGPISTYFHTKLMNQLAKKEI